MGLPCVKGAAGQHQLLGAGRTDLPHQPRDPAPGPNERCKPALQRVNDILVRMTNAVMPLVLLLLGLALIADAIVFFSTGNGLF